MDFATALRSMELLGNCFAISVCIVSNLTFFAAGPSLGAVRYLVRNHLATSPSIDSWIISQAIPSTFLPFFSMM